MLNKWKVYLDLNRFFVSVVDIKGMKTPDFKLKEKMFKYKYGDKYNFICLTVCPKKYQAEVLKDESAWWGQLGFIENSLLEKLRKISKKTEE